MGSLTIYECDQCGTRSDSCDEWTKISFHASKMKNHERTSGYVITDVTYTVGGSKHNRTLLSTGIFCSAECAGHAFQKFSDEVLEHLRAGMKEDLTR